MAVSTWYQNWNPPVSVPADAPTFNTPSQLQNFNKVIVPVRQPDRSYHGIPSLLPYFVSMGLLTSPQDKEAYQNGFLQQTFPKVIPDDLEERTGPFRTVYQWKQIDLAYPSREDRDNAIRKGDFIPGAIAPLGIEVTKDRLFITMPVWKPGIPVTLGVLPKYSKEVSPAILPYPSWEWHNTGSCFGLTSVFRVKADSCGRLWVLDAGEVNFVNEPTQMCPPTLYIFSLQTDELLLRYQLPDEFNKQDGLYANIIVDIRDGKCDDAYAYMSDSYRYGLVVYSLKKNRSWRITDHLFFPDPFAAAYNLHGLEFDWVDGIFSMSLGPFDPKEQDKLLYFRPMSSFREFYVKSSVIRNETGWMDVKDAFKVLGESRGPTGQVISSAVDRNGVMLYNLALRDSVGCWDTRKPYIRANQGVVASSSETMVFPNDLKLDEEPRQGVWIITNKLPFYLYSNLDLQEVNIRIMTAYVDESIKGTVCDPDLKYGFNYDLTGQKECY